MIRLCNGSQELKPNLKNGDFLHSYIRIGNRSPKSKGIKADEK